MATDSDDGDAKDGSALGETGIRINPEILKASPLTEDDLKGIEVILVQSPSVAKRLTEGVTIHLAGSGLVAFVGVIVGFALYGPTPGETVKTCVPSTVSAPIKLLE